MTFSEHLADYLQRLTAANRFIVVRDPASRYRQICQSLAGDRVTVVDVDRPSIEVREELVPIWNALAEDSSARLVIYRSDVRNEALSDPLLAFEQISRVFPGPGVAYEDYRSLARTAYPHLSAEVDALFDGSEPSIAALDSLAGGNRFPSLTGITGRTSPIELLIELLTDGTVFEASLATPSVQNETIELVHSMFGLNSELTFTDAEAGRAALWRFLLYSEFILDLPDGVPAGFTGVPCAPESVRTQIYAICKRLRSDFEPEYVERAERVAQELELPSLAKQLEHLGEIDTFAFESAAALKSAVASLAEGEPEKSSNLLRTAERSIWSKHDFMLQSSWQVVREALATFEAITKAPAHKSGDDLVSWYAGSGMNVDRAYRSFWFTWSRLEDETPYGADLPRLVEVVAFRYREWLDIAQMAFLNQVRTDGWPLPGMARQDRIYADTVASALSAGKRVAYFLVDALRYELGDALAAKLEADHRVSRASAAALLPTTTPLGMAALAPEAAGELSVSIDAGSWTVSRGGAPLFAASDRDKVFLAYHGDQVLVETLEAWLKRSAKQKPEEKVRLAVVRSTEIDSAGEIIDAVFRSSLENLMSQLARGIRKCFSLGFDFVAVAADHGFLYLPHRLPGDQLTAPAGTISAKGRRYLFGKFDPSDSLMIFSPDRLGYRLDNGVLAVPASSGTFGKPEAYVHGGLSLQEALIPVLTVEAIARKKNAEALVTLSYRGQKSARVTTLTPSVTIAVTVPAPALDFKDESVSESAEVEIVILDAENTKTGRIGANEFLDTDTGYLRISPGTASTIPLRLSDEVRGECTVRAVDPATGKIHDTVTLNVDILD